MLLSSLEAYIVIPVIAVVAAQYAFALFCLMKLAYLDVSRKHYVLWNLLILIVFFIGGIVFLVYYRKHPELLIEKTPRVTDTPNHEDKPIGTDETEINHADEAGDSVETPKDGE